MNTLINVILIEFPAVEKDSLVQKGSPGYLLQLVDLKKKDSTLKLKLEPMTSRITIKGDRQIPLSPISSTIELTRLQS